MKKKIFALFVSAVLILAPAAAAPAALSIAPPADRPQLPARIEGVITRELDGAIEVEDSNTGETIVLNITRETSVLDAETGAAMAVKDRENNVVIAYYGPAAAMSMPPQSSALAVFLNSAEELVTPHYAVAEAVEQEDGETRVLIYNGSQYVVLADNTPIFPYLTRNIVTREMIRPGTKLALWYGITTLSYPGIAHASRAVILQQPAAGSEDVVTPPGTSIPTAPEGFGGMEYDKNGVTMIPLRIAAEARGYDVKWDGETRTVWLRTGGDVDVIRLVIGVNDYMGFELEYPPEITNDRTFVPETFLEYLA